MYDNRPGPEHIPAEKFHRLLKCRYALADHLAEAPVATVRLLSKSAPCRRSWRQDWRVWLSSIYPAVQNILLTCRALGLGSTLTTVASLYEEIWKKVLGAA
jgi:nitroreductase